MAGFAIDTRWRWHVAGGFALCNFSVVARGARSHRGDFIVVDLRWIPVCCAMANFAFRTRSNMTGGFSGCTHSIVATDASRCDIAMIEVSNRPIDCVVMAGIAVGAGRNGHMGCGLADGATCRKHAVVTTVATRRGDERMAESLCLSKGLRRYVMARFAVDATGRWKVRSGLA